MGEILLLASDVPDDLAEFFEADEADMTDVLRISTKPFKEAHFACFPPALVEPCVLAGTSERGACSVCGTPWRRVVERGAPVRIGGNAGVSVAHAEGPMNRNGKGQWDKDHMPKVRPTSTTGWQPTCTCPAATPIPCTVLDPFSGAASAGLAALKHGRYYIGIDLNADYVAMAQRRIAAEHAKHPLFPS